MASRILVSSSWLRNALFKNVSSDIKVLESSWIAREQGKKNFIEQHIPTARFFDMWKNVDVTPHISRPLPDLKLFEKHLESMGVCDSDHLVLYDKSTHTVPMFSARMYMQCKHIGLERVSVLDGGFHNWTKLGYEVQSGENEAKTVGTLDGTHSPRFDYIQSLSSAVRDGSKQIVDTRAPDFFRGEHEEPSPATKGALQAAGVNAPEVGTMNAGRHIGARNVFFEMLREPDTACFKSKTELQQMFSNAGVNLQNPTIATCYNGLTACMIPLVADKCDISPDHINVYIGSWTEFGQLGSEELIEKEAQPPSAKAA